MLAGCLVAFAPQMVAQNSIQLFGPINVRVSAANTSYTNPAIFNSNTLNLTCSASPITAVLSSSPNPPSPTNTGNVLVDNNIYVTNITTTNTTTNVCAGGVDSGAADASCFTTNYQAPASAGSLTGVDPDSLVATGGVSPIDISSYLVQGTQQVRIDLEDEGGYLTSSTLYLNTNCASGGVNGPALISGNTIPSSNPSPQQLDQDFTFNPVTNNMIGFEYDLTGAELAGSLTIDSSGVNPQVGDSSLDPATFQTQWAPGTSFATSICLVHSGELLPSGLPGCKLYTLECTTGTGSSASGAQCPVSSLSNELLSDVFDGPAFTLNDIPTPGGPTFHEGMGLLMASEGWTGGACTFDPASGLQDLPCPQNLLTSFSGPGGYTGTGTTTHPNSTFISVAQVPEDLTTVTVAGMQPGNWINSSTANVTLTSQPPSLAGSGLPGAGSFVASPIQSITYGISPANSVPTPGTPIATDTTLTNSQGCPNPAPGATAFAPPAQALTGLEDGNYLLHYYAQDCAGTQEFKFTQQGGSWSTNFYTFAINVDTVPPQVTIATLSTPGPYYQGQPVTATYSCTDGGSGVVACGSKTFAAGTANTGTLTAVVNTLTPGANTFNVTAKDAAGNQASQSVNYQVAVDSQVQLTLSPVTVTYPLGTNLTVEVTNLYGHVPTGTVEIMEKGVPLASLSLKSGAAYYYLKGLAAGMHYLSAVYSGDHYNPGGISAQVALNVLPVPVTLSVSCWNSPYPYGANYQCTVNASSNAGAPAGSITYVYDGGAPIMVPLVSGAANITLLKPPVGNHNLVVTYPAQTNYAAAAPQTENFTVTPAPVVVQFTPSTWYLTTGNLTLTALIQSWSAGPPNNTGQVTFADGKTVLSVVPVNSSGSASFTITSALANGNHTFTATYSGGVNYATGSTSITVQVAH